MAGVEKVARRGAAVGGVSVAAVRRRKLARSCVDGVVVEAGVRWHRKVVARSAKVVDTEGVALARSLRSMVIASRHSNGHS